MPVLIMRGVILFRLRDVPINLQESAEDHTKLLLTSSQSGQNSNKCFAVCMCYSHKQAAIYHIGPILNFDFSRIFLSRRLFWMVFEERGSTVGLFPSLTRPLLMPCGV